MVYSLVWRKATCEDLGGVRGCQKGRGPTDWVSGQAGSGVARDTGGVVAGS